MTASQLYSKKPIYIRPKEIILFSEGPNIPDLKRKRHAQTQKHQRDRMKAALDLMANTLEARGVGTTGSRAEVVEAAVEHILSLQAELDGLRQVDKNE
ncbi:hypothetical protein BJX99DRAFT_174466 [Aspergillus californicus]